MALDSITMKLYDPQTTFVQCTCCSQKKIPYTLKHSDTPIQLPADLVKSIEILLWYSPNVASEQTFSNEYLKNKSFENAVMTYFLAATSLTGADVLFLDDASKIENFIAPYKGSICECCNKMILSKYSNETKLNCILRHLRNSLAHGRFNLLPNGGFIGFDEDKNKKISAIIKLKIHEISRFCLQLLQFPDFTVAQIVCFSLAKDAYYHFTMPTGGYNGNRDGEEELVFIKSKKKEFAIRFNCSRYQTSFNLNNVAKIDEYQPKFDDPDFTNDTKYIDVYYCQNARSRIRKVCDGKYIISKRGLEALANGTDLQELIKEGG